MFFCSWLSIKHQLQCSAPPARKMVEKEPEKALVVSKDIQSSRNPKDPRDEGKDHASKTHLMYLKAPWVRATAAGITTLKAVATPSCYGEATRTKGVGFPKSPLETQKFTSRDTHNLK